MTERDEQRGSLEPLATPAIVALVLGLLVLFGLVNGPLAYGLMSDEYYYLDCASRLAWGYVDHPPLSIAVLAAVKATLGSSLPAVRLVASLLVCLNVVLVALLARELGGGRTAQSLAALAAATAPVYLAMGGFYSMNSFEPAIWSGSALLLARIANGDDPRLWLGLGILLGLGLLNKISVSWLGLGLAVGLVMTPQRRWLATPWPYACAALALAIFAPHLYWQSQNDWPTLEFMRNARDVKMVVKSPLDFLLEQLVVLSPAAVPVWLAGLAFYFLTAAGRRQRWLGWIWLTVVGLLLASGTARSNYSAPAYAVLLAGGGVAVEGFAKSGLRRALPALLALLLFVAGLGALPLALPVLPPADLARYAGVLQVVPQDEKEWAGLLPQHLSLRLGWDAYLDAVAEAESRLAPGERLRAVVVAPQFGAAGVVNYNQRKRGLPPAVSGHNNYWLWGPGETDGEVIIAVTEDPAPFERAYRQVEHVADVDCEFCARLVDRYRVYVCRGLRTPLDEFWQSLKHFI